MDVHKGLGKQGPPHMIFVLYRHILLKHFNWKIDGIHNNAFIYQIIIYSSIQIENTKYIAYFLQKKKNVCWGRPTFIEFSYASCSLFNMIYHLVYFSPFY